MQKATEDRFTFDLGSLPTGEFVKLSDALDLAFYGGIPSVRYEGPFRLPPENDREYAITNAGEWVLITDGAQLLGPKDVDIANPGAILFGIDDDSIPDPVQLAAADDACQARRYQIYLKNEAVVSTSSGGRQAGELAARTPRRLDVAIIDGFWQAEIGRRRTKFLSQLNAAARAGDVRFMGLPVDEAWILEPSTFSKMPQEIPTAYFVEDRNFDEDSCIHAIGEAAPEPDYDGSTESGRYVSYRDVVVERASYLRFLNTYYPAVLNPAVAHEKLKSQNAIKRLTQELRERPKLAKAEAANIVGWGVRSRPFDVIWKKARDGAGLDPLAPPGRKKQSAQT
ncbi:hypothetical protein [Kaistia terrae]|uniref:Uncharacterized protein n=1 Tax=Kaistia terrae TaxID=537017 RepID=A0ABW0PPH6_9HYPH|nr:hypothetical protein [Kaistia terrae]MCX5580218.1 hypothetical protein [Kaistia terrae]